MTAQQTRCTIQHVCFSIHLHSDRCLMMSRDDISCVPCKLTASGASTSRSRIANAKYQSSLECSTPRTAGVYGVNSWAVNTSTHIIPSRTSFQYIYIYISLVTSGSKDQFTKNTHTHTWTRPGSLWWYRESTGTCASAKRLVDQDSSILFGAGDRNMVGKSRPLFTNYRTFWQWVIYGAPTSSEHMQLDRMHIYSIMGVLVFTQVHIWWIAKHFPHQLHSNSDPPAARLDIPIESLPSEEQSF